MIALGISIAFARTPIDTHEDIGKVLVGDVEKLLAMKLGDNQLEQRNGNSGQLLHLWFISHTLTDCFLTYCVATAQWVDV